MCLKHPQRQRGAAARACLWCAKLTGSFALNFATLFGIVDMKNENSTCLLNSLSGIHSGCATTTFNVYSQAALIAVQYGGSELGRIIGRGIYVHVAYKSGRFITPISNCCNCSVGGDCYSGRQFLYAASSFSRSDGW